MAAETLAHVRLDEAVRRVTWRATEKIIAVGDAYVGIAGWAVTQTVLQSAFASGCEASGDPDRARAVRVRAGAAPGSSRRSTS